MQIATAKCTEEEKQQLAQEMLEMRANCEDKTQQLKQANNQIHQLNAKVIIPLTANICFMLVSLLVSYHLPCCPVRRIK